LTGREIEESLQKEFIEANNVFAPEALGLEHNDELFITEDNDARYVLQDSEHLKEIKKYEREGDVDIDIDGNQILFLIIKSRFYN